MSAPSLVHGVALEQYAAVNAAIAEPFPVPDVLAIEGLEPDTWPAIAEGWVARLVEDARVAGELLVIYRRALGDAEDRLGRRVSPLDDDPAAWVSFLAAFSANRSPNELLEKLGLGMNDLSRLQRRWSRKIEESPSLEKAIVMLQKKGPGKLPRIIAEPARLSRSSSKYGIESSAANAATDRAWREVPAKDAVLARDFPQPFARSQERLLVGAHSPRTPAPQFEMVRPLTAEPVGAFLGTMAPLDTTWNEALPFERVAAAAVALENAKKHTDAMPSTLALPPADALGATALASDTEASTSKTLPFGPEGAAGIKRPPPHVPTSAEAAGTPPANLPDLTVQQYASLRVELRLYPDRTQHTLARYRVPLNARSPLDRHWRGRFAADPALLDAYSRAHTTYQASLAGAGGAADALEDAAARSPVASMSLEQYAALWVEMKADPHRATEIQARYGIRTPAAWATTRQHWDTRLSREPALQARWAALTREIAGSRRQNG